MGKHDGMIGDRLDKRRFMARHKVVTTDAEIDRAIEQARSLQGGWPIQAARWLEGD